jgi:hypothetical protein
VSSAGEVADQPDQVCAMLPDMSDALWWVGSFAVLAGLGVLALRLEPHWVSRDGARFTCRVQEVRDEGDDGSGRWRERHAQVVEGRLRLGGRGMLRALGVRSRRELSPPIEVIGRAPGGPSRFALYVLASDPTMVLRVPSKSRAVPILDSLVRPG